MVAAIAGFAATGVGTGAVGVEAGVGTFIGTTGGGVIGTFAAMVPVLGLVAGVALVPVGAGEIPGAVVEGEGGAGVLTFVIGAGTTWPLGAGLLSTATSSHGRLGRVPG